jgi:hypothetical protein
VIVSLHHKYLLLYDVIAVSILSQPVVGHTVGLLFTANNFSILAIPFPGIPTPSFAHLVYNAA